MQLTFSLKFLSQEEYNCVHEKTTHCAINGLFLGVPAGEGGPVRVRDEHFGASVVPLYEYEDNTWGGSCVLPTPGRSSASIYFYTDPDTSEYCLAKSDTHLSRTVRCMGCTHFGEKAKCCVAVRDHWNRSHPDDLAQFVPEYRRPIVVNPPVADVNFEDMSSWPQDHSKDPFIAQLCVDWKERDPNGESLLAVFFCFCFQFLGHLSPHVSIILCLQCSSASASSF